MVYIFIRAMLQDNALYWKMCQFLNNATKSISNSILVENLKIKVTI